jgi:hypothetical protein
VAVGFFLSSRVYSFRVSLSMRRCTAEMEIEVHQSSGSDAEKEEVNDCTGVLKLDENVKVYSCQFTHKSLSGVDIDDKALLTMLISHCTTNFSLQHHNVRAFVSSHRVTHFDELFVMYVISIITPMQCKFKYSKLTELKEMRMMRIADIEVGYKEEASKEKHGQKTMISQITLTVHSTLNRFEIESISITRINFNRLIENRSISDDLPNDRGVLKRPRRS